MDGIILLTFQEGYDKMAAGDILRLLFAVRFPAHVPKGHRLEEKGGWHGIVSEYKLGI
jgi:hypothetical protein